MGTTVNIGKCVPVVAHTDPVAELNEKEVSDFRFVKLQMLQQSFGLKEKR